MKTKLLYITTITASLLLFPLAEIWSQVSTKDSKDVKKEEKASDSKSVSDKTGDKKTSDTKAEDKSMQDKKQKEAEEDAKKTERLMATLNYGIQKDRKTAINLIKTIKDQALQKKLMSKVIDIIENDADMEVRKTAITVAGDLKTKEAEQAIIRVLDDDSEDLVIAACYAIEKLGATAAKPRLIEILKKQDLTKDSNLTTSIINTIDQLGAPEMTEFAVEVVKDAGNSKMVREKMLLFIGKNGSATQKDFLLGIYKDDDQEMIMRAYAVKSIAKLKITEAAEDIKSVVKEIDSYPFSKKKKYYDLYINSVAALAEMGDKEAIPLLMDSLRSDNASVRLKAVNLIKEFNDERTIDILKYKMDNDPSAAVRKAAKRALEDKGIIEKSKDDERETGTERDETEDQR